MKIVWVTFLILCSCASTKTPEELAQHPEEKPPTRGPVKATGTSIEAKELGATEQANAVVEVEFARAHSGLGPKELAKLAKLKPTFKTVKIVSWADMDYPASEKKPLPQAQITLAAERIEAIEKVVMRELPQAKIEKFNMAERPGRFAEWYSSNDATIKRNLERAGVNGTLKASRAIVLFVK